MSDDTPKPLSSKHLKELMRINAKWATGHASKKDIERHEELKRKHENYLKAIASTKETP